MDHGSKERVWIKNIPNEEVENIFMIYQILFFSSKSILENNSNIITKLVNIVIEIYEIK